MPANKTLQSLPLTALASLTILTGWLAAPVARGDTVFSALHDFGLQPYGSLPVGGLVQGGDGAWYGVAQTGGALGNGTVFKITTAGIITTLHSFAGGKEGYSPFAGLARGNDGNFYGTTESGGTNDAGTLFKMTPDGSLTTLAAFADSGADSVFPYSAVTLDPLGNIFGARLRAGGFGEIYQVDANGNMTILYSFSLSDGAYPYGPLLAGNDGNFYGVTSGGGVNGFGTVFQMTPAGALTTLYNFQNTGDGIAPAAPLTLGIDGNFYGTTSGGDAIAGTIFQLAPNGNLTTLQTFPLFGELGGTPQSLTLGTDGNFYGITPLDNDNRNPSGRGTVFRITPAGEFNTKHIFAGGPADGLSPVGGLAQGSDGDFHGTTRFGGTDNLGTVFQMTTNGTLTDLYSFTVNDDGNGPSGLVAGGDGYLYGTTQRGGDFGAGTVYRIDSKGVPTTLYAFTGGGDGGKIYAGLTPDGQGNLYGSTSTGGAHNGGTLFRITTSGGLTTLYSFPPANGDGEAPFSALTMGADGNIYGTGAAGGFYGNGILFRLTPDGGFTNLYSFTGTNDGGYPVASLALGKDGNFYGVTSAGGVASGGTLFKATPAGTVTILHIFAGPDGAYPNAGLTLGTDGNFYGTTKNAGSRTNGGTIFRITPTGSLTTLRRFSGTDGLNPKAPLIQGTDGNFYGTTSSGVTNGYGTLFEITTDGVLTVLHTFAGGTDGGYPQGPMAIGADGNIYGTANGGPADSGVIFQLKFLTKPAPVITSISPSGGNINVSWTTVAGGTYQMQAISKLGSPGWINLGGIVTGTGLPLTYSTAMTGARQFFRVKLLNP